MATALLTAGCGAASAPASSSGVTSKSRPKAQMKDNQDQKSHAGMEMTAVNGPSTPASMICTDEIKDAVTRTFALAQPPTSNDTWDKSERLYSCDYRLPQGVLTLSVHDAEDDTAGRSHFDQVRDSLPTARNLRGLENFGFPAFATTAGKVAFLKDGKTLLVDASALPDESLPTGYTRQEAAYSVASAVIACWSE